MIDKKEIYDVAIIGTGPAGFSAAIYASRYKLKTIIFGKSAGGNMMWTPLIENYPGFEKISGVELAKKMEKQVEKLGVPILKEEVKSVCKNENLFGIQTEKQAYFAKTIIIAWGTQKRKLNVPNEDEYIGKGIAYCATCDAPLFKNKDVAIVGGGNSAAVAAKVLREHVKKIYMIYLDLIMDPVDIELLKKDKKIEFIQDQVTEIKGNGFVESAILKSGKKIDVSGIFVEIGDLPNELPCEKIKIKTDKKGYILTNNEMETSAKGVFAAGDCISKKLKQIINATGDGAVAAHSAFIFLKN